ncbi:MAG: argininosuccinate lyase [bacterium]
MAARNTTRKTTVGAIDSSVLDFTAGSDLQLDLVLVQADCIGSAAHATMLARMPVRPKIITDSERRSVIRELKAIMQRAASGQFSISMDDQDVHLAVERILTAKLGDLGKKIHTGRSRNDQVALDLRLFTREQLIDIVGEVLTLAGVLVRFARQHEAVPMVGRTHMQPAMPSSVGLWASAHAESLLDDVSLLMAVYELNDQCPLGSAASYGVPLPIDRALTSQLLGFSRPVHNVLYANNARGKIESLVLQAMVQVMLSLSRMAQDLMLYTMPEFGYFTLPAEYGTGSSIMPQKNNPDVVELVRARVARVMACEMAVMDIARGLPSGYNRDLQETKGPFMEGISMTRGCLAILPQMIERMEVNREALLNGFTPGVFATDRALELVGQGMPFRDAYNHIKANLGELETMDAAESLRKKTHLGAPMGLDFGWYESRIKAGQEWKQAESSDHCRMVSKLMGLKYPIA